MNFLIDKGKKDKTYSYSRRSFITSSAAILGAFTVAPVFGLDITSSKANSLTGMQGIAEFLTAKKIDAALANKAGAALSKIDSEFTTHLISLANFIIKNNIQDIETLKSANGFEGDIKLTAQKIISALYLGYAGDPIPLSSDDNVQFVTYTQAITFKLTERFTPIPSYSRWGTGYWEHLPSSYNQ